MAGDGGNVSAWSTYQAVQDVNMNSYDINNLSSISSQSASDLDVSCNQNLNVVCASGSFFNYASSVSTSIQQPNEVVNKSFMQTAINNATGTGWYSTPAGSDVNMANFDINNCASVNSSGAMAKQRVMVI